MSVILEDYFEGTRRGENQKKRWRLHSGNGKGQRGKVRVEGGPRKKGRRRRTAAEGGMGAGRERKDGARVQAHWPKM